MKHLLLIIIYRVIFIVLGSFGCFDLVKREKKHRLIGYILVVLAVGSIIIDTYPNFKDMICQETNEIEAIYLECHTKSKALGKETLIFKDDDTTYEIIISSLTSLPRRMEKGKTYKIEYYDNSKVLKSCVLIE